MDFTHYIIPLNPISDGHSIIPYPIRSSQAKREKTGTARVSVLRMPRIFLLVQLLLRRLRHRGTKPSLLFLANRCDFMGTPWKSYGIFMGFYGMSEGIFGGCLGIECDFNRIFMGFNRNSRVVLVG